MCFVGEGVASDRIVTECVVVKDVDAEIGTSEVFASEDVDFVLYNLFGVIGANRALIEYRVRRTQNL